MEKEGYGLTGNESYLAGAILVDGTNVLPVVRGLVKPEDFQIEAYRAVFTAAASLAADGEPVDPCSIKARAKRQGVELPNQLLTELMEIVPTCTNAADYAHRVAEDARVRRIKELATRIQEDSVSGADELLAMLQQESDDIRGSSYRRGLLSPADTLHRFNDLVVEAGEGRDNFVPSGFPRLDEILGGGFIQSGLYILGARPAMGKSTFAVNLADNIGGNVLLVSLEMSPEQLTAKRVARLTGIPAGKLLRGAVTDEDWQKFAVANSALSEQGVYINSRYGLTVPQIQLLAQSVPELRAVIIDYLGLIQPATRGGNTYENVSQISRELKLLSISLNVPVICLCQLSRSVESREDKRPRLSDLRDSGAIEQDADAVLFLWRDGRNETPPTDGNPLLAQLDVAKNRHGATGETQFSFWMRTSTFKEIL